MPVVTALIMLKGQCHEILTLGLLHGSFSPKPLIIPLGRFRIFSQSRGDIRSSRCTTGVVDTGGKLLPVSTTLAKLVAKFATGVIDTAVSMTPVVHLDLLISPRIFGKI